MTQPRIRVLPYKQGSRSAKALAEALGGKVLKLEGSTFTPRLTDLVINWGKSDGLPVGFIGVMNTPACTVFNSPEDIRTASNKLNFFQTMESSEWLPKFWTNKDDIPDEEFPVVCRTVLSGHSGAGIVIATSRADLVDAQLFVKYIKKEDEYRVHVGRINQDETRVISLQRKARRNGHENPNWQVRNHANGFVFVRNSVNPPLCVTQAATEALGKSGLDFGAVDVIYNAHQAKAYVLEINTAPGLEGQTVTDYANFFKEMIQ